MIDHSFSNFQMTFVLKSLRELADHSNPTDSLRRAENLLFNALNIYSLRYTNFYNKEEEIAIYYAIEFAYKHAVEVLEKSGCVFEIQGLRK